MIEQLAFQCCTKVKGMVRKKIQLTTKGNAKTDDTSKMWQWVMMDKMYASFQILEYV